MYRLYTASGAAGMAPHAALEEIDAPHELVLLDIAKGEHQQPSYLEINPKGRVPALIDGGEVLTESAAILVHLVDKHPEAKLAPPLGTLSRGHFYEWLFYLSNTIQPTLIEFFYPEKWFAEGVRQRELKASAERRLGAMCGYVEGELAKRGPYLLGPTFSGADLFLHMLVRWTRWLDEPAYRLKHIKRCTDLVKQRPAVRRMMEAEGIVEEEKAA
jgi:glutathione S-transferase